MINGRELDFFPPEDQQTMSQCQATEGGNMSRVHEAASLYDKRNRVSRTPPTDSGGHCQPLGGGQETNGRDGTTSVRFTVRGTPSGWSSPSPYQTQRKNRPPYESRPRRYRLHHGSPHRQSHRPGPAAPPDTNQKTYEGPNPGLHGGRIEM